MVERDYAAIAEKMAALGPLVEAVGVTPRVSPSDPTPRSSYLRAMNGTVARRRRRRTAVAGQATRTPCEAILALSGTTNGQLAVEGFQALERRTGTELADLAAENEGKQITFADTQARPMPVITSPEWSGSETGGRRYSPFTINIERAQALAHPDRAAALLSSTTTG